MTTDPSIPADRMAAAVEKAGEVKRCGTTIPYDGDTRLGDDNPNGWPCGRPCDHDGNHGPHDSAEWRAAWITAALPDLLADRDAEVERLRDALRVLEAAWSVCDDDRTAALARVDAITALLDDYCTAGCCQFADENEKRLHDRLRAVLAEHAGAKP